MRCTLVLSLATALLVSIPCPAAAEEPAAILRRFFDEEWAWDMADAPEAATLLGDRSFDDRLTDLSPAAYERRRAHLRERLQRARGFERAGLDERDRLSLDLFITVAERDVALLGFPSERLAITQQGGPHRDLPVLAQVPAFREARHYQSYLVRLRAVPRYIDQVIALLEEGRRSGWVSAREPLRDLPRDIRAVRSADPAASVFYDPFKAAATGSGTPAGKVAPAGPSAKPWKAYADQALLVIARDIDPAFEKLARYVEETYLPATRSEVGAWALPEGAAYYEASLRAHTTTRMSAEQIHALGLSEVQRIEAAMTAVMRRTGHTGSREAFNERLRTEARFFYPDGAQLLLGYRDIAKRIDAGLPRLFGVLPRLPYGVSEMPALEAPTATTAYYRGGALDDGRAGNFVANTYRPETRPRWEMEALTLHEAVPGHHLQIALAQELSDLPRFRREVGFTAFTEGWGLYAESLGPELGLFTDPYAKYGQLTYEMWRAVRLVVDTGMHARRWTRAQAIDFFLAHTAKTRHDIEVEVDRYLVWPGQALAYKVGELEIKRLRALAERALGPRFDVRKFHDAVLGAGALPLDLLDRRVRAFIEAQQPK